MNMHVPEWPSPPQSSHSVHDCAAWPASVMSSAIEGLKDRIMITSLVHHLAKGHVYSELATYTYCQRIYIPFPSAHCVVMC